jgi:hypothetical protein
MMHTSIIVLAFSGFAPTAEVDRLTWLNDYYAAVEQGAERNRPVAVFLASGQNGWKKVARGNLSSEAQRVLASQYVCVHVDTATPEGRRLARAFEIPSGLGIVISDRTGQLQAFSHEGDLSDAKMVRYLRRYGDPWYVVSTTETNPSGHVEGIYGWDSYAPPAYAPPAYAPPAYSSPRFSTGRSC